MGTATTADAVSCDPMASTSGAPSMPKWARVTASIGPIDSPGWTSSASSDGGMPDPLDELDIPRAVEPMRPVVEAFVRSVDHPPGHPVAEQVGQHEQPVGDLEQPALAVDHELVDGRERHALQAAAA